MYGKLNRTVATPWSEIARQNPARNGCSIPAPAPWATASHADAAFGAITIPESSPRSRRSSGASMGESSQMQGSLYLGTSGFAYDEWKHGVFYPEGLKAREMLS